MPKKLAYHCTLKYEDKVIIHGGLEFPRQPNMDTFILNLDSKQWIKVADEIPCGRPPIFNPVLPINSTSLDDIPQPFYRTTCNIWHTNLVVATFDYDNNESCSAILNLIDLQWKKIKDPRAPLIHGALIMCVRENLLTQKLI